MMRRSPDLANSRGSARIGRAGATAQPGCIVDETFEFGHPLFLLKGTLTFLVAIWPVTFVLLVAAAVGLGSLLDQKSVPLARGLWALAPYAIVLAVLALGVARHDQGRGPGAWEVDALRALVLLHVPLAAVLLWRGKGMRVFLGTSSALAAWVTMAVGFMSFMSVTGARF